MRIILIFFSSALFTLFWKNPILGLLPSIPLSVIWGGTPFTAVAGACGTFLASLVKDKSRSEQALFIGCISIQYGAILWLLPTESLDRQLLLGFILLVFPFLIKTPQGGKEGTHVQKDEKNTPVDSSPKENARKTPDETPRTPKKAKSAK